MKKRCFAKNLTQEGRQGMSSDSLLKDKVILVVDDEPDVLEAIADELDMCIIHKAQDYGLSYGA
jgi:hypothetical protein